MKRIISLLLALVLCFGAIPFFGIEASAATSSAVANAVSNRLPLVTYAMPLSGASKVYSYSDSNLSNKTTGYYIDSFKDQIVITKITDNGNAVYVTYPSSSSSTGYRSRWFATNDILGLATVDIRPYTCSSGNTTYRMSSASAVTSYGSISKNDSCVMLGNHTVGGKVYYPTIYPISSGTYNKVSGVRNKLALGQYAPSNAMRDVTASFANKTITIKSVENGKYLCADSNASGTPLRANKDQAITWETFTVSPLTSDGWVGFKAHNGKWLSAMADTTNTPIGAKYDNLYSWECFRIYQKGNDYYIKAQINSKWLCVRVDTDQAPVQAYASAASTWERLSINIVVNDSNSTSQSMSYALYKSSDGRLTCGFDGYKNQGSNRHEGIDFAKSSGSQVYSLTDGVITRITEGSDGSGSNKLSTIAIYYAEANKTVVYLHANPLDSLYVGQHISRGQQIATEANRGASAVHTHVEVRNGRCTSAAISSNSTLDNPNPTAFWNSLGYSVK